MKIFFIFLMATFSAVTLSTMANASTIQVESQDASLDTKFDWVYDPNG